MFKIVCSRPCVCVYADVSVCEREQPDKEDDDAFLEREGGREGESERRERERARARERERSNRQGRWRRFSVRAQADAF